MVEDTSVMNVGIVKVVIKMVEKYLKLCFDTKGFNYEIENGDFVFDCGGNPLDFARVISFIYKKLEDWTYDLELDLKIEIRTGYEKIVVGIA